MAFNSAARLLIGIYKVFGIDMSRMVCDEKRFNVWANLWLVGVVLGLLFGLIGLIAAIIGISVELAR